MKNIKIYILLILLTGILVSSCTTSYPIGKNEICKMGYYYACDTCWKYPANPDRLW